MAKQIRTEWMRFLLTLVFVVSHSAHAVNDSAQIMLGGLEYTRAELVKKQKEADDALKKCKAAHPTSATSSCKDEQRKVDEIKEALAQNEIDAAAATDTAQASSGAGLGDTLNKLLPIATMGIMACMALGCFDKDKNDSANNDHALLPNGAIDCSKADASQYSDCDQYLIGQCSAQFGMLTMTPNCNSFTSRFCAQGPPQPGTVQQMQLENGAVVQLNIGGIGVGQDQSYCQTTYATAYCKDGANAACPACLQMQAGQSQACQANPALCIAQNSPSQMAEFKNSCPGDPAIALYEKASGALTGGTSGAPPITLPVNATQTLATAPGAGGGISTSSVSSGGISLSSVRLKPQVGPNSEMANREGQTGYTGRDGGGAVAKRFGALNNSTIGSREVASGGVQVSSAASAGPASDVQGQFGPSLFAMGSKVIRQHCQQKQFNGCP